MTKPSPIPYSKGLQYKDLIFVSGHIGVDPKTNNLVEGIEKQTRQTLENLEQTLETGGADRNCVLKTTVFLKDMKDYDAMNKVYGAFFQEPYPTRSTVEVTRLPKDALIEIECIAKSNECKGCGDCNSDEKDCKDGNCGNCGDC